MSTTDVRSDTGTGGRDGLPAILRGDSTGRLLAQVRAGSGQTLTSYAPYTGAELAVLPQCDAADVEAAYTRARAAQRS